jgi:hypothetical protein
MSLNGAANLKINLISLWGILDGELVELGMPNARPVLICGNKDNIYDIELNKFIRGTFDMNKVFNALNKIETLPINSNPHIKVDTFKRFMFPSINAQFP